MLTFALSHSPFPLLPSLPNFKTLKSADQLHARLITSGAVRRPSLLAAVVLRLLSSPHPPLRLLAHRLIRRFSDLSANPNDRPFLWNALIKSSSHGPDPHRAILTFSLMLSAAVPADGFSFSLTLKACSRSSSLKEGSQIHSLLLKSELSSDLYLQNSLIGFYSKCGCVDVARQLFDRITHRDSVSWNSMIDGYLKNGKLGAAEELFDGMGDEDKNLVTWNSMVGGYVLCGEIDVARKVFDGMPERDSVSWNLMIDGYAKCGRLDDAVELFDIMPVKNVISWANLIAGYLEIGALDQGRRLFDEMPVRDVITWNIVMTGYVKNGRFVEALCLFNDLREEGGVAPDSTTLATALSAISELGRIRDGIAIHEYIERNSLPLDGKLGVGLIDMYSKCGQLRDALRVFEISGGRRVDHWNAMIGGLAIHGYGRLALELFRVMERQSMKPDDITFIGILNACSHSGLVKEGLMYFERMRQCYNLEPKVQHYGCMVDILGRAGRLDDAWKLIELMPVKPNDVVWKSLLSACMNHAEFDMGLKVAKVLIEGDSCNSGSYVLLSKIYAALGMWEDVRKVRVTMRERNLGKVPGCSWIELDGIIHEFVVGDNSHPQAQEVYSLLEGLCTFKLYSSHDLHDIQ